MPNPYGLKLFELTLVCREGDGFEIRSMDKIEADNLVELMSKLTIVIAQLMQDLGDYEKAKEIDSDAQSDLPF